jgi:hypothetical protein
MSGCVARRAAAIGPLILPIVAPVETHHPGGGGNAASGGPIKTVAAEGKIAAADCHKFIQLGQLDDAALLATAEHGRNSICSIESVMFSAADVLPAYVIINDILLAVRIPHVRHSDISETAEQHRGQPRPNDDVVAGIARPANGSRTAVTRSLA